jgi:prepilin-type N-terminal cleavage/methylation domain-containing protein
MRARRGFTLIELMVVLAIVAVIASLAVWQGRSARSNVTFAGGAYGLALRIGGIKARAMADGREHVLVVVEAQDAAACRQRQESCGRIVLLRSPAATFAVAGFDPDAPIAGAEYVDDGGITRLPAGAELDVASTWRAPPPFDTVTAFDPNVLATCAGGRRCFGIRFRPDGEVRPELPAGTAVPAGFAFVLRRSDASPTVRTGAERRAIFISFPAGIVKTAAF